MSYLLLIVEPEGQRASRTESEGHEVYDRMVRFAADLQARGQLKAVESLGPLSSATRVSGGGAHVLDGPFAEAKEMIGGFFLLQGVSRDEAIAIARACPAAEWATVEVRALAPCYES